MLQHAVALPVLIVLTFSQSRTEGVHNVDLLPLSLFFLIHCPPESKSGLGPFGGHNSGQAL